MAQLDLKVREAMIACDRDMLWRVFTPGALNLAPGTQPWTWSRWPVWPQDSTPAHAAAKKNAVEFLEDLVCKHGMPVHFLSMEDDDGFTPAHVAARCGHADFLRAVGQLCRPASTDTAGGKSALGSPRFRSHSALKDELKVFPTAAVAHNNRAAATTGQVLGWATGLKLLGLRLEPESGTASPDLVALDKSIENPEYQYSPAHVAVAAAQPEALAVLIECGALDSLLVLARAANTSSDSLQACLEPGGAPASVAIPIAAC